MSILPSPSSTRLVTIVAHVDHGKTTLADSLIEHNGIISERLAGSMRFLDSLEEEQRRGITIRSSAIALKHTYRPMKIKANPNNAKKNSDHKNADNHGNGNDISTSTSTSTDEKKNKEMVIHLIDSPGHVDFSMEVSSALQICDGALLIVDVVEGMCARTQSILREAYAQKLVPILVLNKMDRLCTDLGLNVNEAYLRIRSVVESVNAAASAMIRSDKAKEGTGTGTAADDATGVTTANNRAGNDAGKSTISATTSTSTPTKNGGKETNKNDEEEDEEVNIWTFEPSKGNVVFASAIYGWGFTIPSLARSLFKSKTIKVKPPIMRQYLFGDFKYDSESGKLLKWKQQAADDDSASTTMFAEYGLKPLWSFVEGVSTAATSLGKESIFFSANNYSTYTTNTNTNDHHDYNEEKSSKKQNNAKIEATTPGMNDSIFPSLQIGATVPDDVQKSLQTPKTLDEMQQILNKTTASSEELILRALLRRHRPLSGAVLDAVCDVCPSPSEASSSVRQEALSLVDYNHGPHQEEFDNIQNAVKVCNADPDSPTFAHCSKFISTSRAHINDNELFSYLDSIRNKEQESEEEQNKKESVIILGVGRVLSGVLRSKDIEYYCYGPKYDPNRETEMLPKKSIRLYILMGSSYVRVNSIPAGHICAIHGLEELQLKTVSLCSSPHAMPLGVTGRGIRPLVKVNVEAKSASDTAILEKGLAKLSLADPAVEITATAKGERILACLGELHLEQSILDLQRVYCGEQIELRISEQIIEFGETTTWFENEVSDFDQFYNLQSPPLRQTLIPPYCYEDGLGSARNGRSRVVISNKTAAMHVRVIPLPKDVYDSLVQKSKSEKCEDDLILIAKALNIQMDNNDVDKIFAKLSSLLLSLDKKGNAMIQSSGMANGSCIKGVQTTRKHDEIYIPPSLTKHGDVENDEKDVDESEIHGQKEYNEIRQSICKNEGEEQELSNMDQGVRQLWSKLQGSCTAGFQAGCASGPLCEESVRGVLVILEGVEIAVRHRYKENSYHLPKPISGGMIVASLRTGIRCSLLTRPTRLVEGYLRLTLHSSLTGLGPLYAILSRRRGSVISDTMVDGTDLISIDARLPQSESFGLAPELLQKSSGEVTAPELIFSHWEVLDEDPFWIPTSLEEREDYGEIVLNGDSSTGVDNTALKYIRMVRDRKGLIVDSNKIIVAAEKQRTLARKK